MHRPGDHRRRGRRLPTRRPTHVSVPPAAPARRLGRPRSTVIAVVELDDALAARPPLPRGCAGPAPATGAAYASTRRRRVLVRQAAPPPRPPALPRGGNGGSTITARAVAPTDRWATRSAADPDRAARSVTVPIRAAPGWRAASTATAASACTSGRRRRTAPLLRPPTSPRRRRRRACRSARSPPVQQRLLRRPADQPLAGHVVRRHGDVRSRGPATSDASSSRAARTSSPSVPAARQRRLAPRLVRPRVEPWLDHAPRERVAVGVQGRDGTPTSASPGRTSAPLTIDIERDLPTAVARRSNPCGDGWPRMSSGTAATPRPESRRRPVRPQCEARRDRAQAPDGSACSTAM